ncbi:ribosome small subunit-stimulated GTPase EngC [Vibrio astriarenae]|nr:ribosome small subunit-stimulated GTPase EngC [Vibrio sp. C7]
MQQAVQDGHINRVRFDNYHRILESMAEGKANRQYSRNKKPTYKTNSVTIDTLLWLTIERSLSNISRPKHD